MNTAFVHPYMPNSVPDIKQSMLDALGIRDVSDLYEASIPEELRFRGKMNLPEPVVGEPDLAYLIDGILQKNTSCAEYTSFLGGGCYRHYVPAVCDEINTRAEFLTAYCGDTYSDHGKMQAIFEYCSLMAELLDMDLVSYTLYDGGQATASALRMAIRIQAADGHPERTKLLLPDTMNPEILSLLKNYCKGMAELVPVRHLPETGLMDLSALEALLSDGTAAAVFFENPSYLGFFESQAEEISKLAHKYGALSVVSPEVASLGVIEAPANYGADIVCGDIQPLGMHIQFGGGCAGFIATPYEEKYIQQYPTYMYGLARTAENGAYGFGRALNYRCSHGSRENANEYFGTETGLWCITAAVYLSLMGPSGMRDLGELVLQKCHYAVQKLSEIPGLTVNPFGGLNFQEFIVNFDTLGTSVSDINRHLLSHGIFGGIDLSRTFPELGQSALFCVTETTRCDEIDRLSDILRKLAEEHPWAK